MRILLLNPNTTAAVTERLMSTAQKVVSTGTTLVPVTATRGVPYIATRAEAQIGGAIALEMLAENHSHLAIRDFLARASCSIFQWLAWAKRRC
jgi:allantoin racemase